MSLVETKNSGIAKADKVKWADWPTMDQVWIVLELWGTRAVIKTVPEPGKGSCETRVSLGELVKVV